MALLASCSKERVLQVNRFPNQIAEGSDLYVTGSFNNWNPADPQYKLEYDNVLHVYTLELPHEVKEGYYLYSRGTTASIESDVCGNERALRIVSNAEITLDSIEGWSDLDHPLCSNITFIVKADRGMAPATDRIYLTTESVNWKDKNEAYKFKAQANGTYLLSTQRSPQHGLLFNLYHNGIKQFERPIEAPTFNDTITLTLSASASAEAKRVERDHQNRKDAKHHKAPTSMLQTITLDPVPVKEEQIPPQYRKPAPVEQKPVTTGEIPAPVEQEKPANATPAPVVIAKAQAAKQATPAPVVEQAVEPDKRKKVFVIIDKVPTYGKADNFYLAGDFNDWNIADPNYRFGVLANGKRFLAMRMNDYGAHEFKITRGEPGTDEANYKEEAIDLHEIKKGKEDDTIHVRIDSWMDAYERTRLVFYLMDVPENTPEEDPLYLAGDFNKWNLKDENYKFTYLGDNQYSLIIDDFSDRYQQYKITRGDIESEAVARNGRVPGPQPFVYIRRDTMRVRIERWKDLKK